MSEATLQDWAQAAFEATRELADTMLFLPCESVVGGDSLPDGWSGGCLPLMASGLSLHIGFLASDDNAARLAGALLGFGEEEDPPSEADVRDAMGEIANIIAGMVKRSMTDKVDGIQLGLPIFVNGFISIQEASTFHRRVKFGDTEAHLVCVVAQHKETESGSSAA